MLPGTRFRDDAFRAQALRQQGLADGIVDLVRAGMCQVFALQPDISAPALAEPRREAQRGRAANPLLQFAAVIVLKARVVKVLVDACLQTFERGYQRLRYISPTEWPKAAALVGQLPIDRSLEQRIGFAGLQNRIHELVSAACTACMNCRIRSGSFIPGRHSTALDTSTPQG